MYPEGKPQQHDTQYGLDTQRADQDSRQHTTTQRTNMKVLPKLLQQEKDSQRRSNGVGKSARSKKRAAKERALMQKEALQKREEDRKGEQGKHRERRKAFREEDSERRGQQKQRKEQGFVVRRVGVASVNDVVETKSAVLTAEDATKRATLSGKILARLTEQLRLITGLRGSNLETLRRWNQGKSMDPRSATPYGKGEAVVRVVKARKEENDYNRATAYIPTIRGSKPTSNAPLQRRKASHRHPEGLAFVMKSFQLAPSSPSSPQPRKPHTLAQIHTALRKTIRQTQLLTAQASSLLPSAPVLITRHAARVKARSPLSRIPVGKKAATPAHRSLRRDRPHLVAQRIAQQTALSQRARVLERREPKSTRSKTRYGGNQGVVRKYVGGTRGSVKKGASRERVKIRKTASAGPERLVDEVGDWLGGGSGGGGGI